MSKPNEDRDVYYIPPNFLTSGRLFGGMIRARNAIEACVLVLLTGVPIIKLPFSLTTRIIILCLVSLPLGIFGVIGFEGDSLSEFAVNWVRWLIHRRTLYRSDTPVPEAPEKPMKTVSGMSAPKPPEQLGIKIKEKPKKRKKRKPVKKPHKASKHKSSVAKKKQPLHAEDFIPVRDIRNGIIETTDGRYLRVIEVEPINFLLRNISEQKNIVASFASWMKISPVKVQIKVLTKKADIGKHLNTIEREMEAEDNPKCRDLQLDYYHLIQTIGSREAITRRFLVIFEYEAVTNRKPEYAEIVSALETAVQTARQYFLHCDNAVVAHEDENIFLMEVLYTIFNRATCEVKPVEKRVRELQAARKDTDISVPVPLKSVLAPESIDLTRGSYVVMDGVYHAYAARDREVAFIIRLLTIFGVVEQRQMRLLFNHLSNRSYGQILARLRREGLAYFSPDGQFLATSRYSLDHGKTLESVMVFWAFIKMRDNVLDFCASDPPAILSFSSAAKDYDLIPGSKQNIPAINAARTVVAEATVRLIVVDDLSTLDEVEPRLVNDYGILVGPNGVEQIYKM